MNFAAQKERGLTAKAQRRKERELMYYFSGVGSRKQISAFLCVFVTLRSDPSALALPLSFFAVKPSSQYLNYADPAR